MTDTSHFEEKISIIIPAKNEALSLDALLPALKKQFSRAEIIVVNDGSTDDTSYVAQSHQVIVVDHPYSMGQGAAIKSGSRKAKGDIFIFMDADGQHQPDMLLPLLDTYQKGYDMVVGARKRSSQANMLRYFGNTFYNFLASCIVGHRISDLTSGLRVVNAKKFKQFLTIYPNGFSTPTTVTMAFFRSSFSVTYIPVDVLPRTGTSHLLPFRDGLRFLLIIYKMTVLYSPLKVFLPFSALHFLAAILCFSISFFTLAKWNALGWVLMSIAILIFLLGLLCEQITTLIYTRANLD